ncbi:hypothetical protein C8Q79DRAFT_552662 [Trametes meyenii]|nr:hypothetical protein C8Q79DRAFT_552662 [Trametes meyenii]
MSTKRTEVSTGRSVSGQLGSSSATCSLRPLRGNSLISIVRRCPRRPFNWRCDSTSASCVGYEVLQTARNSPRRLSGKITLCFPRGCGALRSVRRDREDVESTDYASSNLSRLGSSGGRAWSESALRASLPGPTSRFQCGPPSSRCIQYGHVGYDISRNDRSAIGWMGSPLQTYRTNPRFTVLRTLDDAPTWHSHSLAFGYSSDTV